MRRGIVLFLVLLVVAAAAVGAWLLWRPSGAETDPSQSTGAADPVDEYLAFADGLAGSVTGSSDPAVVVDGLRRLAGAIGMLQEGESELPIDLRIAAEHLVLNPDAAGTTESVRKTLIAAASALGDDAAAAQAAEAIDPRMPIAQQQPRVVQVFARVAEAIRQARRQSSSK